MKLSLLSALGFFTACLTTQGQLTLNSGDIFTYEFSSLPLVGTISEPLTPLGNYSAILNPATVQEGDTILLEMFENSLSETPIDSRTWMNSPLVICQAPAAWADLQGAVRLTMLSGSVTVDVLTFRALTPTGGTPPLNHWEATISPVPEPSTLALLGLVFGGGVIWRIRRRVTGRGKSTGSVASSKRVVFSQQPGSQAVVLSACSDRFEHSLLQAYRDSV